MKLDVEHGRVVQAAATLGLEEHLQLHVEDAWKMCEPGTEFHYPSHHLHGMDWYYDLSLSPLVAGTWFPDS